MRMISLAIAVLLMFAESARAFCGFYVARADGALFNKASKVVLSRHGQHTVITMASDVSGDAKDFALVIPVPSVVTQEQVRIVRSAVIDHLDGYTAPRLVEYRDEDPCLPRMVMAPTVSAMPRMAGMARRGVDALGVRIEAQYSVGEYDIVVLSAADSGGLLTWLNRNGYRMPAQAEPVVRSYLAQNMRFFVAKVNLQRQAATGSTYLRPIQVEYDSAKFMLPIRLGTVNADGPQEMIALTLTEKGRVETTNYRTMRLPSGDEVPLYVKETFGSFYKEMFSRQVSDANGRAVFLEYAWDMNWCDPCAADPMSADELRELGAAWTPPGTGPTGFGGGHPVFVTRLHVRYDRDHFPEDLALQETADRENFQARFVLRHPYLGPASCERGRAYEAGLPAQYLAQARTLNELTGWPMETIRARMAETGQRLP